MFQADSDALSPPGAPGEMEGAARVRFANWRSPGQRGPRPGFTGPASFLLGFVKIKRGIVCGGMWKLDEIQIPASTGKVLLGHSPALGFPVVHGCFCPKVAAVSSCDRGHMAHKAQSDCSLALYRAGLLTLGLEFCLQQ